MIKTYVRLEFLSIAIVPFEIVSLALANPTLKMRGKMTMAIVRVKYLVLLKTKLAEAIFGKKFFRVVSKSPEYVCLNKASKIK